MDRFNQWNVDELIYLDISSDNKYDLRRNDSKIKNLNDPLDILDEVSKQRLLFGNWEYDINSDNLIDYDSILTMFDISFIAKNIIIINNFNTISAI